MDRIQDENARLTFAARITTARVGIGADRGVEHRHMRQAHLPTNQRCQFGNPRKRGKRLWCARTSCRIWCMDSLVLGDVSTTPRQATRPTS